MLCPKCDKSRKGKKLVKYCLNRNGLVKQRIKIKLPICTSCYNFSFPWQWKKQIRKQFDDGKFDVKNWEKRFKWWYNYCGVEIIFTFLKFLPPTIDSDLDLFETEIMNGDFSNYFFDMAYGKGFKELVEEFQNEGIEIAGKQMQNM